MSLKITFLSELHVSFLVVWNLRSIHGAQCSTSVTVAATVAVRRNLSQTYRCGGRPLPPGCPSSPNDDYNRVLLASGCAGCSWRYVLPNQLHIVFAAAKRNISQFLCYYFCGAKFSKLHQLCFRPGLDVVALQQLTHGPSHV